MKIRTASRITLGAIVAAVSGSLAIAFWATTIAVADTTPSGTMSARREPTLRPTGTPQYQIFDIGIVQPADEFSQLHLGATTLHTSGRLAHALAPITQEPQSAAAHGSRQKAEATEQEARRFTLAGSS